MNFTLDQLNEAQQKLLQENQQLVGAYAESHASLAALKAQRKLLRQRAEVQLQQLSELKVRIETVAAEIARQTPPPALPEESKTELADAIKAQDERRPLAAVPSNGPAPSHKPGK